MHSLGKRLKVLDGNAVQAEELQQARHLFVGRLSLDYLTKRLSDKNGGASGNFNLSGMRTLDLTNARLHDFGGASQTLFCDRFFPQLRVLILDGNPVRSLVLGPMQKLAVLKLNRTRLTFDRFLASKLLYDLFALSRRLDEITAHYSAILKDARSTENKKLQARREYALLIDAVHQFVDDESFFKKLAFGKMTNPL